MDGKVWGGTREIDGQSQEEGEKLKKGVGDMGEDGSWRGCAESMHSPPQYP